MACREPAAPDMRGGGLGQFVRCLWEGAEKNERILISVIIIVVIIIVCRFPSESIEIAVYSIRHHQRLLDSFLRGSDHQDTWTAGPVESYGVAMNFANGRHTIRTASIPLPVA